MDKFIDSLQAQFSELASKITQLAPIADQPAHFAELDKQLVTHIADIKKQYDACKTIEALQEESQRLDQSINSILIQLGDCRKQLSSQTSKSTNTPVSTQKVDSQMLLEYATKITRFTRQIPGTLDPAILPWPTEDWLRRGMLATLTIQDEQDVQLQPEDVEPEKEIETAKPEVVPTRKEHKPKAKISLDFDSDED